VIDAMSRHEIQVLRAAKIAQHAVAAATDVSVRSVRRIEHEAPITTSDTAALISARRMGRPSIAAPWADLVQTWLQEEHALPGIEILRRLRDEHAYVGGKSAVYELVRRLRPRAVAPLVRFEGVPGEFSQHDFGQVDVRYTSGVLERVHFFASRLKWSRVAPVVLVPNEQEEPLVRGLLEAFEAFGGVPLVTIWDNPKTVVVSRKGELIVWNSIFGHVALDYRFAPELCWPRSGQQKGAVENLVGWVKGSFFKCRRFHDRADLEVQLAQWLLEVNTRRPCRATGIIPSVRLEQERLRLRALPIPPAAYALKIPVVVSVRALVAHEGMTYSMPPDTIGQPATLHLYRDRVEIVPKAGPPVPHPRVPRGSMSILAEHRSAMLGAVRGVRARLYYQRQSLWELGPAAEAWLTELIHRRPGQWRQDVEHCFTLLQEHGPERLLAAFAAGIRQHAIGAEYVVARLRGLDAERGEPRRASRSHADEGGRYLAIPLRSVSEGAR
jgi:transposase